MKLNWPLDCSLNFSKQIDEFGWRHLCWVYNNNGDEEIKLEEDIKGF